VTWAKAGHAIGSLAVGGIIIKETSKTVKGVKKLGKTKKKKRKTKKKCACKHKQRRKRQG
jgi:hypothetical protein